MVKEQELIIYAPVTIIWALLTEIDDWPRWQPRIKRAKTVQSLGVGAVFHWQTGRLSLLSEIHAFKINERIAWRSHTTGLEVIYSWRLETKRRGVLVRGRVEYKGWRARLFRRSIKHTLGDGLDFWIHRIKEEAERSSDYYQSLM